MIPQWLQLLPSRRRGAGVAAPTATETSTPAPPLSLRPSTGVAAATETLPDVPAPPSPPRPDADAAAPAAETLTAPRPSLAQLAQADPTSLPLFVQQSAAAQKYLGLLGGLNWDEFPERPVDDPTPGPKPAPRAPYVAAFLIRLDKEFSVMSKLREYLVEQPALVWLLGFPLVPAAAFPWGFDGEASLPSVRHFNRVLRNLRPEQAAFLLRSSVQLLAAELADVPDAEQLPRFGDEISLDTKHILAWVKENNPKQWVSDRFNKEKQPAGDPDCKLGCKKKRNLPVHDGSDATPTQEGLPVSKVEVGEYYWGYASGVVATKHGEWGEFVLAELTQTFDCSDPSYFFPLMRQTEENLGRLPRSGAFDGAFDAHYVYDYFAQAGGFAAIPYAGRDDHKKQFDPDGLPLCAAGLAMPLRTTFVKRSHCLVPHECGRHACPLLFPEPSGENCPVEHANWDKGGCITTIATGPGARLRHQLDRKSEAYEQLYDQRTATERINSQAVALGIERPKLRNARSIARMNTLRYVLINLRGVQRIRQRKAALLAAA